MEIAESSVAEEEKESSKSRPGNNAKEGDDTDGEEQAQTSPEMTEHQTKAHTEEPVTIQAEDHTLRSNTKKKWHEIQVIVPPIQIQSLVLQITYQTPPFVKTTSDQLQTTMIGLKWRNLVPRQKPH